MMNGLLDIGLGLRIRLQRGWAWLRHKIRTEPLYKVAWIEDEPDRPIAGLVYVIEDAGVAWAAAMACPGGCGQVLHMISLPTLNQFGNSQRNRMGPQPFILPSGGRKDAGVTSSFDRGASGGADQDRVSSLPKKSTAA